VSEVPRYLADPITPSAQRPTEQASDPPRLALSQCHVPRHHSVTARSLWLLRARGISCRRHFVELTLLTLSDANSFFFAQAFLKLLSFFK